MKDRRSGILLHITSLPGREGIGTLGDEALKWIDFLKQTGQKIWQILPLGPVGYSNSPYLCFSAFAGNPMLIDLFLLAEEGMLEEKHLIHIPRFDVRQVQFSRIEKWKIPLLQKAYERFAESADKETKEAYKAFLSENRWWLDDYALFMSAKTYFGGIVWQGWPDEIKYRNAGALAKYRDLLSERIEFHRFMQFLFFRQWKRIHDYAGENEVAIIGDMPLYVGGDSVDVWANTGIFQLDDSLMPRQVGGVPPDYFSETGQLWGNPVFDWDKLKAQDYHWWMARIHFNLRMFDKVRIDHFRGLESYWAIPADESTAVNGEWHPAHGSALLSLLRNQIGELPLIAEDLGVITENVDRLREEFALPGMKVLQFAFSSDAKNNHLPHNYDTNCLVYTGTHDNDTTWAWIRSLDVDERKKVMPVLRMYSRRPTWAMIEMAWSSVAKYAILPLQDLLELGAESRMNIPGFADGNWGWRFRWNQLRGRHMRFLREITLRYNR